MRNRFIASSVLGLLVSTGILAGCASTGSPTSGSNVPEVQAPTLQDWSSHIRPDGSMSAAPVTTAPPSAAPAPGQRPSSDQVVAAQPTVKVDPALLRELKGSVSFLDAFQAPNPEIPAVARGCNVSRNVMYFRRGDRNPFGVVAVDPKTNDLYWPEMFAFNAVSTEHELNASRMVVCYNRDSTYSTRWAIPLQAKTLRTNLQGITVGNNVQLYGAGKWLLAPVPQRLSDEMRGIVRDANGEPMKDTAGQIIRRYTRRQPAFYLEPENLYITPDTFSNASDAVGATANNSDMSFDVEERPDGCLFKLGHDATKPAEGVERVIRVTN